MSDTDIYDEEGKKVKEIIEPEEEDLIEVTFGEKLTPLTDDEKR